MQQRRTLEMTVISAEGLHRSGNPVKKNVFVVVSADNSDRGLTTALADAGISGKPCWEQKLMMDLPGSNASFITLEVRCKIGSGSDKLIGIAKAPVSDFTGGYVPENYLHFLSYRLRDINGCRNGIINFSIRTVHGTPAPVQPAAALGAPISQMSCGGVAIGVPAW